MEPTLTWKERLSDQTEPALQEEIDVFETQIELRKQGRLDEKIFAETRLRRGVYGQRYDNGQRHDGIRVQELSYPSKDLTKGPETLWDAPGMQRIKIPFGGVTPRQMEVLADLSEEYSDGVLHVTTRQDFQLHFVHIDDTPDLMRRLASVGITTREACGNTVRNVTACPLAGVCRGETFDVTPHAKACSRFLLGHPDTQDFGRKFKVAFSGCREEACGLARMHDIGAVAATRSESGRQRRGFELYVGGGLGAVPHQAQLLEEFLPEEELLPTAQAIGRIFARMGEKTVRSRARLKFLVSKLGIEEFRNLVARERETLPRDPAWTEFLETVQDLQNAPEAPERRLEFDGSPEGCAGWAETNVYSQRQEGFSVVTVNLPLGDLSAWQMRQLAHLARRFSREDLRTTVEQNLVLRWVRDPDVPAVFEELKRIGLADPGAGTLVDIVACPGTDTCKLGIASSTGLAAVLRSRLAARFWEMDRSVRDLKIKISGCFNSCGQHHVADIGFYGTSRTVGNRKVPHFQVVLGGQWKNNAGSYGLAIGSVPAKNIPSVVDRISERYLTEREGDQSFQDFVSRVGKRSLKESLADLVQVPEYRVNPDFYSDWGDPREFTLGDMGVGECAGEVVSLIEFDLAAAERLVFEAQLELDGGRFEQADALALQSMLQAAKGLLRTRYRDVSEDADTLVKEFKRTFYDSQLFYDRYAGGKFAQYLFRRHENPPSQPTREQARQLVEEAQLFIEASHACRDRIAENPTLAGPVSP